MGKLQEVLGDEGLKELTDIIHKEPQWWSFLKGSVRSKLMWLGAVLFGLPGVLDEFAPHVMEFMQPEDYQRLMSAVGVAVMLLRAVTTKPISKKAMKT